MNNISTTLIFFGNERLSTGFAPTGAPTLLTLLKVGYDIKAVVAHHGETHSRNSRSLEIEEVARAHDIPVLIPAKPGDIYSQLADYHAVAAIVVAYGKIIPQSIIDIFPHGIINIHPSLLPLYRGPTPIEQALRDGVPKTGVSLMQLIREMDRGPIFAQQEVALVGSETKLALTNDLLHIGAKLLIKNLPSILDGSLPAIPQTEAHASYTKLITKDEAWFNLSKPAEMLEREIRAFEIWPKSKLQLYGHNTVVTKVRVATDKNDGVLVVNCGKNTFLEIQELIAPSGKTMSGAAFLRGYAA